jgi:hypothetical protein
MTPNVDTKKLKQQFAMRAADQLTEVVEMDDKQWKQVLTILEWLSGHAFCAGVELANRQVTEAMRDPWSD